MTDFETDPPSPCVGVCMMNPRTELCEGCYRTLDEISGWWHMSAHEKRALAAELERRQEQILDGTF